MNNLHKTWKRVILLTGLILLGTPAFSGDFNIKRIIVLGDTLSDGGSYSQAMWAIGKPRNIYYRVLENDPNGGSKVWAEFVANGLGLDLKPNVLRGATKTLFGTDINPLLQISETDIPLGGSNYAELGSRVTGTSLFENKEAGLTAISVVNQVDKLLDDNNDKLNKSDLVAIWAGSEDAISAVVERNPLLIANGAKVLGEQIKRLQDHGAKNIIVLTVPVTSADIPPRDPNDIASIALANGYRAYNAALKSELAGKDVLVIQTEKLIDATRLDPTRFGFIVSNDVACDNDALACVIGVNTDPTAGPYTRSDATHPSQLQHEYISQLVLASLQATSQFSGLSQSTIGTIRQSGLSIEERLLPGAFKHTSKFGKLVMRKVGDIQTFGTVSGGYFEENDGQVNPGSKATTLSLNGGADLLLNKNILVGVNITYNRSNVDFGDNSGGFDSQQFIGTLYSNIAVTNSIYVNAAVSAGHIDLDDITRKFNIGPSKESYTADTTGDYTAARIGVGYNHHSGGWTLNPAAAYTYERLKIDGYTESYGVGSLVFGDNTYEASRVSLSLTASYTPKDPYGWKPMFRVSLEHDFKDEDVKVNLGFDKDTMGALFLERPDGTYGTITAGVSRNISENSSFSINATSIIGEDGITGASGGITFKSKF